MHFLDTSAVLELSYGTSLGKQIKSHIGSSPICISALTVHELLVGLKESELQQLQPFLTEIVVVDFTTETAKRSAEIERELRRKGKLINRMDILIAGISLAHNHELLTCDKDFLQIKELPVKIFSK